MALIDTIKADQRSARMARNAVSANLLTTLLGEVGTVAKNAGREQPTDEEVTALLKKFVKNTQEMIKLADSDTSRAELAILESYLPKQLTTDEIKKILITAAVANKGAAMKFLKENYNGQYDGKAAAEAFDSIGK